MLHCRDCFHHDVCMFESRDVVVDMCLSFLNHTDVIHGKELMAISSEIDALRKRTRELSIELEAAEFENKDLEDEVKLLRIIKQTLEMQSGMKFDI